MLWRKIILSVLVLLVFVEIGCPQQQTVSEEENDDDGQSLVALDGNSFEPSLQTIDREASVSAQQPPADQIQSSSTRQPLVEQTQSSSALIPSFTHSTIFPPIMMTLFPTFRPPRPPPPHRPPRRMRLPLSESSVLLNPFSASHSPKKFNPRKPFSIDSYLSYRPRYVMPTEYSNRDPHSPYDKVVGGKMGRLWIYCRFNCPG
jgi:hypothetical protein